MMDKLRSGVLRIVDSTQQKDVIEYFNQYLPHEFEFPTECTGGEDVIDYLLEEFDWFVKYGDPMCVRNIETDHMIYWFPFMIHYTDCAGVQLFMINLKPNATQRYAYQSIQRSTDYTPYGSSGFKKIPNYYDHFVIPTRVFYVGNEFERAEPFYQLRVIDEHHIKFNLYE